MGRPPIGNVKMTDAERQRRHRARVRQTFRDSSERVTKPGPARREAKAETAAAIGGRLAGCEVMAFDDDGVIRILEYVGRESVPHVLNSELRKDILAAWDFYQGYKRTTAKGPRTRQHKYADTVSRKADELFKLLTDPEPIARLVARRNEPKSFRRRS